MDSSQIERITRLVVQEFSNGTNQNVNCDIPIGVSARHVHLAQAHVDVLFGLGYQLTKHKNLSIPSQFAANERVKLVGHKQSIENVCILGPIRTVSQVEVSMTDARTLGISAPLRESGNVKGSAPLSIVGPRGTVYLPEGCIVAARHVHMSPDDATRLGLLNGQDVCARVYGLRATTFYRVKVRVDPSYLLELHIDTDEANAANIKNGDMAILIK